MKIAVFTTLCLVAVLTSVVRGNEDFKGVKEVRLGRGDPANPKSTSVVIADPAKIAQLVATIKLEKKPPCACDHIEWATFVKDKSEIKVSLCDHCFDIGRDTYTMPDEFYKLFTAWLNDGKAAAAKSDASAPAAFDIKCRKKDDTITVSTEGGKTILTVTSVSGIGGATVERKNPCKNNLADSRGCADRGSESTE